jgi:hypothetical protein
LRPEQNKQFGSEARDVLRAEVVDADDNQMCAERIVLGSSSQFSKRELQLVTWYNHDGIAIEAFKRPLVRVQASRIDAGKHRGAAVWAKMNFNFARREAK